MCCGARREEDKCNQEEAQGSHILLGKNCRDKHIMPTTRETNLPYFIEAKL